MYKKKPCYCRAFTSILFVPFSYLLSFCRVIGCVAFIRLAPILFLAFVIY